MPVAEMLRSNPAEVAIDQEALARAVQECIECAQACTTCSDACAGMEGMARCARLCLNCADVCHVVSRALSRKSEFQPELVRGLVEACARWCGACADECSQHDMDHCRVCGDACRRCEEACDNVAAALA